MGGRVYFKEGKAVLGGQRIDQIRRRDGGEARGNEEREKREDRDREKR